MSKITKKILITLLAIFIISYSVSFTLTGLLGSSWGLGFDFKKGIMFFGGIVVTVFTIIFYVKFLKK